MPVCLLVALSALFGSVLAGLTSGVSIFLISFGMLCLACGGAAMNSLQEIGLDASMVRTQDRPLPKGLIGIGPAFILAVLLILAGLFLLFLASHLEITVFLGLAAVILYNLVYTNLKTKSVAAIIPGAISGALPPYIGWTAAGGDPLALSALFLGILFILWQVPHSLLIHMRYRSDYLRNEIPSLVKIVPEATLKRLFLIWLAAFVCVLVLFTQTIAGLAIGYRIAIWFSAPLLFLLFVMQLYCKDKNSYYCLFVQLNGYLFFIMMLLISERLFMG
jgi:protoheme IX farnesyltransferase